MADLRVALVHDFLLYPGGAEKVLQELADIFPSAPIYTLLYEPDGMRGMFQGKTIKTSFLQKLPRFIRKHHRWLLFFLPPAAETFDLREYDLVISSSGAWTKGIVTRLATVHIAYIHSPMRFVWDYYHEYLPGKTGGCRQLIWRLAASYLRIWDKAAAERPDYLVANSRYTQERIRKYYRRESRTIHPPIAIGNDQGGGVAAGEAARGDYFLVVSRLSPYKKVDLVVEAFNKLGLPLVVIGEGQQAGYLRKIARSNVRILGWQSEKKVREFYAGARALIFPACDDFGMTMVEAMGHGVPVVAFRKGGAEEVVVEGETGILFESQTVEVLADGIRRFISQESSFDRKRIVVEACKYSRERFRSEWCGLMEELTSQ